MLTRARATVEDLYKVAENQKAELVNGQVVLLMPTGDAPGYAGDEIFASLREYVKRTGRGRAVADNKGFLVRLPHRESFSPDAAFYTGPRTGMRYFEAGTQIVWDVDLQSEAVVQKYTADNPHLRTVFRRGEVADAEPAVPGWRLAVDNLFE